MPSSSASDLAALAFPDRSRLQDVATVIAAWGMWVKSDPNGVLDHPSRIFLLDPPRPRARDLQPRIPQAETVLRTCGAARARRVAAKPTYCG